MYTTMNKIIIVDDHSLFREGIKLLIENEELGEVIAEADNGMHLLHMLKSVDTDVILLDIQMPGKTGFD